MHIRQNSTSRDPKDVTTALQILNTSICIASRYLSAVFSTIKRRKLFLQRSINHRSRLHNAKPYTIILPKKSFARRMEKQGSNLLQRMLEPIREFFMARQARLSFQTIYPFVLSDYIKHANNCTAPCTWFIPSKFPGNTIWRN